MTEQPQKRFAPPGPLALEPSAFGLLFFEPELPQNEQRDDVAVVKIRGPLMKDSELFFDSYESIRARFDEALATEPRAIVMSIDSPGGLVAGCFETVTALREKAERAGCLLIAYVDGQATSAAYALACAASRIVLPPSALLGSVGVIDALIDSTDAEKQFGLRTQLITSGERKGDGHGKPNSAALMAAQARVNDLAELFFDVVAEGRPGVSADDLRGLEAGIFIGSRAVDLRLADQVMSFDALMLDLTGGRMSTRAESDYEEGVAKLRKAAEGDDEEAKRAKRMLAALEDEEDEQAEGDDDEPEAKAEDDDEPEAKAEDDDEPEAKALKPSSLLALASRMESLEKKTAAAERKELFAKYPHVTDDMKAAVKGMPLEDAERVLKSFPKPKAPAAAAATTPRTTRGEGQGDGRASALPPEDALELDVRMGLAAATARPTVEGNRQVLPVMTKQQALAELARKGA